MNRRLDLAGMMVATGMYLLSVTPSLLPRPWALQAILSGLLAGLGYALGVGAGRLVRPSLRPSWRRAAGVALIPVVALFTWLGVRWQRDVTALVGAPGPSVIGWILVPVIATLVLLTLLAMARALRAASRRLSRRMPKALAALLTIGAVVLAVVVLAYGVLAILDANFKRTDESVGRAGPPPWAERSGSAKSLVSWDSLGALGRGFTAGGPTVEDITRFTGRPARQPIRVYVGRNSAPSPHEEAALAVRELERTGAFSRAVLCVATSTGRGLVDENYVEPLEYMYNGDSAVVSTQYSYQASWLSFLTDRDQVRIAARELFDQVHARWAELPVASRPRLLVFGESLGAFGADSVFHGLADMRARVDGALFVGPPSASPNWRELLTNGGSDPHVRVGESAQDLVGPASAWDAPRIAYLRHATDPVVWWSPDLLWRPPDHGQWFPVVTFAQVTIDLMVGNDVPSGNGHNYRADAVSAWARIAPPPDWGRSREDMLRSLLGHQS